MRSNCQLPFRFPAHPAVVAPDATAKTILVPGGAGILIVHPVTLNPAVGTYVQGWQTVARLSFLPLMRVLPTLRLLMLVLQDLSNVLCAFAPQGGLHAVQRLPLLRNPHKHRQLRLLFHEQFLLQHGVAHPPDELLHHHIVPIHRLQGTFHGLCLLLVPPDLKHLTLSLFTLCKVVAAHH